MKRFLQVAVIMLVLGGIVIGLGLGCAPAAKVQKLVGVGSFGIRAPVLEGRFSVYLTNPHSAGNIIIDKVLVVREDGVAVVELTPEGIETPKGQDNILEPYESWEFVVEEYTEVPPDAKRTYSAVVFWNAEGSDNQLAGWFYQKIIFTIPETTPQLVLTQYSMVNVTE